MSICAAPECSGPVKAKGLCSRHYLRAYNAANRDRLTAAKRARYRATAAEVAVQNKLYREANREKIAAQKREHYRANKAKIRATQQTYQAANREKIAAQKRGYNAANREAISARSAAWAAANPEAAAAIKAAYKAAKKALFVERVYRSVLWERDGGLCHICGRPAGDDWEVEHVIPLSLGGPHCYANTAVSCAPCNVKKASTAFSGVETRWLEAVAAYEQFHGKTYLDGVMEQE